jgi:hypothetical protein
VHVVVQEAFPSCAEACVAKEARERRSGCEQELAEDALPLRGGVGSGHLLQREALLQQHAEPAGVRQGGEVLRAASRHTSKSALCRPRWLCSPTSADRSDTSARRPTATTSSRGTPAFRERLQVVTSAAYPLAARSRVTLDEVGRLAALLLRRWWHQRSRRELEALGKLPGPVLELPIQVARHTLLQGHAAAFFAPSVVAHQIAAGTLVPLQVINLPAILCESALVVHETADTLPPPARAFVDRVRAKQATCACRADPSGCLSQGRIVACPPVDGHDHRVAWDQGRWG